MLRDYGLRYTLRRIKEKLRYLHPRVRESYTEKDYEAQRKATFDREVKFSILVPLYNTPERFLREMIGSAQAQTYPNWELCLADGSDDAHAEVGETCLALAQEDPRIVYRKLEKNLGISENTNACIDMATGNYIVLFDHDDVLHPAALYEVMCAICNEGADYVYTDEATFLSPDLKQIRSIHYKPDFAPDNLWANNYICHLSAFSREVLELAGRFRREYDGSQDHDMILRLTANAKRIVHIPKVLYYWRSHPQSVAMDIGSKTYAIKAGQNAVRDDLARRGVKATVVSTDAFPAIYRARIELTETPKVSILLADGGKSADLTRCVESILEKTTYANYEILTVGQVANDPRVKVCDCEGTVNELAKQASGSYYILLDSNTSIITPSWIEELLMVARRDEVGAVGAKLYYPNDTVAYAGMIIGMGWEKTVDHAFRGTPRNAIGYMGRLAYTQNLSAVSDACMMVRADLFDRMGGMDGAYVRRFADADFCMRLRSEGYLVVWTPFAELYTHESARPKRDKRTDTRDVETFRARWNKEIAKGDPYFNPNFEITRNDFFPK